MKVALVALNSKYIHSNLAVRYLKAYTKDLRYECIIREFTINDRIEKVLQEIVGENADVVAFSCYIWNIDFVIKLSNLIKLVNSDIEILFGGPEVSYECRNFLNEHPGDYIIEGEGEETFREFVEYKLGNRALENINGIYVKKQGEILYNGSRELIDMNRLVFPYDINDDLSNKIVYFESSRGCPFKCKYCLSSTIHGVRFLNIERAKKDLKFLVDKKVKLIKFVDRTFNCDKEFAMSIWEYLISLETETTFHFEISADILNKEQLELLKKAPKGRFQFEIGVQTTNNEVLRNINRFVHFEQIKKQVIALNSFKNIKQHLDLIAGLPGENLQSFKKSFNDLYSIQPEEIQLGFLKVLKGTSMKKETGKWGIVHSPYAPYEVLKTNDISYKEIVSLKRIEEMVDKYYNSQKFNTILKYLVPYFETPLDFYLSLGNFFYDKGYFNRSLSSVDYYRVFLEFNAEILSNDNYNLKEIIKFDYLKYNRKRWLPEFLTRDLNKNLERAIKEAQKNFLINISYEKYHIENFKIDIFKFINIGIVNQGNYYLVFDENNFDNIDDITAMLCEKNLIQ